MDDERLARGNGVGVVSVVVVDGSATHISEPPPSTDTGFLKRPTSAHIGVGIGEHHHATGRHTGRHDGMARSDLDAMDEEAAFPDEHLGDLVVSHEPTPHLVVG